MSDNQPPPDYDSAIADTSPLYAAPSNLPKIDSNIDQNGANTQIGPIIPITNQPTCSPTTAPTVITTQPGEQNSTFAKECSSIDDAERLRKQQQMAEERARRQRENQQVEDCCFCCHMCSGPIAPVDPFCCFCCITRGSDCNCDGCDCGCGECAECGECCSGCGDCAECGAACGDCIGG